MKKPSILLILIITVLVSLQYSSGPASVVGHGYTGAPGENGTVCGSCHNGGAFGTPSAILTLFDEFGIQVTSYVPGGTYQVSLTANGSTGSPVGYGFQLTVLDGNNADVANFSNPSSNAKISSATNVAGGRTYAEHNSTSATNTFTFDWVAPNSSTGDLVFYYNVNLVNGTGGTSGDNGGPGFSMAINESIPLVKVSGSLEINDAKSEK